ncbi:peroxide stress protein YaaA [Carboxylicivirga sp. M1479]|uniref:peroxide stress protein YaaA n=1 Tax=Carboxylicivirga sp. M1479 TaxID=2594476 RepID=UPI0011784508|nr:peroxide stress protein YaaA [Carboxylicivirga sp. M1479]TRX63188.1 peroxide stress protein YaaA [Carboxylicivirga sp. M1479]
MHIVLSPAKSLDYETPAPKTNNSDILFPQQAKLIASCVRQLKQEQLMKLMKISAPLAQLNHHRFQLWQYPFVDDEVKAALFAFKGDVYTSLDAYSLNEQEVSYANEKLRILSGMYGLLRPLDNIMPYRLEMGTKLSVGSHKNLYALWGNDIGIALERDMEEGGSEVLVNLASNEYFKSINKKQFAKRIVTPVFKDWKNGQYKVISFFAKKARGLMTRFIIQNKINNPDDLIAFNEDGYYYKAELSKGDELVFVRDNEG